MFPFSHINISPMFSNPRGPYPLRMAFHITIHVPQSSVFTENVPIQQLLIANLYLSNSVHPASPGTGSPPPSLPAVSCPHIPDHRFAEHFTETLLDLQPCNHTPNPLQGHCSTPNPATTPQTPVLTQFKPLSCGRVWRIHPPQAG